MRWMLLLDTCGTSGSVAVADLAPPSAPSDPCAGTARHISERTLPGRETQERLMGAIDEVLQEASLLSAQLDVLAVVTGPGSFTGIRIGIAAVKGLAEALHIPVIAISRLAVLAAQAGRQNDVQAWIHAGRGDVFVGLYRHGVCVREQMLHGTDAAALLPVDSNLILMESGLAVLSPKAQVVSPVGLREALPLAVLKAERQEFADPVLLDANYLRVPDAELARLAREARESLPAASEARR